MPTTAALPDSSREFDFSVQDFEKIRGLIYDHVGITLAPTKREMVYSRLGRRLRARGLTRFKDYLAVLESDDAQEWEAFTNSLTTNLTAFFREPHHFPLLAEHLKKTCAQRREPMTLWCCASSTGEEPYTIAMTAIEAFNDMHPPVRILATDVDTNVLAQGEAGVYTEERIAKLTPAQVKRFFLKGSGRNAGNVRVRPELRELITFRQLNLLDATWPVRGKLDAIFCRNVMIYFDKPTQLKILQKFAPLLDDGLLFVGHSESLFHAAQLFRLRGKTVYERVQAGRAAAGGAP